MTVFADRQAGRWIFWWYSHDEGRNIYFKDEAAARRAIKANGAGRIVWIKH